MNQDYNTADRINVYREFDAEGTLLELEDMVLEQTMNRLGFEECRSPSK